MWALFNFVLFRHAVDRLIIVICLCPLLLLFEVITFKIAFEKIPHLIRHVSEGLILAQLFNQTEYVDVLREVILLALVLLRLEVLVRPRCARKFLLVFAVVLKFGIGEGLRVDQVLINEAGPINVLQGIYINLI